MNLRFPSLLSACLFFFFTNLSGQDCITEPASIFGSSSGDERGYSLTPNLANDGFYVAGYNNDSIRLILMDLNNQIIWTRSFDINGDMAHVSTIILDSDGMLAISGNLGGFPNGHSFFVLRYDPVNDQILWSRRYSLTPMLAHYVLVEKGPGGDYLMTLSTIYPGVGENATFVEVDRETGDLLPSISHEFTLGVSDGLAELLFHENSIYGIGRYTDGSGPSDMRNTMVKLNGTDGTNVWSNLGHVPANQTARLYGVDMIIDGNFIYSVYMGDPDGTSLTNTNIYIQKTSLDGDLIWVKQYDLQGPNDWAISMVKSGEGLVVLGGPRTSQGDLILFKVDLEGAVLWAKLIQLQAPVSSIDLITSRTSHLIQAGDRIVFTGHATNSNGGKSMFIINTNLNGEINTPCLESANITIPVLDIPNAVFYSVVPQLLDINPEMDEVTVSKKLSQTLVAEGCGITDTVIVETGATICEGDTLEGYFEPGTYIDTFLTVDGCDSIRILHLTVSPAISVTVSRAICSGDSFEGYTTTGIFIDSFSTGTGCDSVRILNLKVIECQLIVHYDLEACKAYMHNGTNMDYTEFVPAYPNTLVCADVSAGYLFRDPPQENKHSCTPGVNGSVAMCVSAYNSCTYAAGHQASVVIEVTMNPGADSVARFTGIEFYQKGPVNYVWLDGPSGPNNYPRRFGIRILKNGMEIFRQQDIPTTLDWHLESFSFMDDDDFIVDANSVFRIELLPYCPIGNGAEVSAWDIDEVRISGGCVPEDVIIPTITGNIHTKDHLSIRDVNVSLSENPSFFPQISTSTDSHGDYFFTPLEKGQSYFLRSEKNDDVTNGVSTIDLIYIQRHLLGMNSFTTLHDFIAADADRSGTVSVIDMLEIRKLLLGIYDEFPRNTSWRFGVIPQDMSGQDISTFNEIGSVENIDVDTLQMDFVGIKIGDINGDVVLQNSSAQIMTRKAEDLWISTEQNVVHPGKPFTLDIRAGDNFEWTGIQFALDLKGMKLNNLVSSSLMVLNENYSYSDDGIFAFSWSQCNSLNIRKGEILFTLHLESSVLEQPINLIKPSSDNLRPEAYDDELQTVDLNIQFENKEYQGQEYNLELFPNPFRSDLTVQFNMPKEGYAEIHFYDISGKLLHVITKVYSAGRHEEQIGIEDLGMAQGFLYCKLISNNRILEQKILKM